MTFRPSCRERLVYALLTLGLAALLVVVGLSALQADSVRNKLLAYKVGGCATLVGFGIYLNWISWTARFRIDGKGVRWNQGGEKASLLWDDIQGLGWRRRGRYLRAGLVEKSSQKPHLFPWVTPEIYRELLKHREPLPPDVVDELKLRG
jgi:hypothetical protein